MEKPFARDLVEADRMVEAVRRARVKLQLAHQMRCSPFVRHVRAVIKEGAIGHIQEVRGRGKEDKRAGGEDLMVLGSHICDVMRIFAGNPIWVTGHVTQSGSELSRGDVHAASEPIGPVAGNQIASMFAFGGGVHGYFASKASDETHPLRLARRFLARRERYSCPMESIPTGSLIICGRRPGFLMKGGAGRRSHLKPICPVSLAYAAETR